MQHLLPRYRSRNRSRARARNTKYMNISTACAQCAVFFAHSVQSLVTATVCRSSKEGIPLVPVLYRYAVLLAKDEESSRDYRNSVAGIIENTALCIPESYRYHHLHRVRARVRTSRWLRPVHDSQNGRWRVQRCHPVRSYGLICRSRMLEQHASARRYGGTVRQPLERQIRTT